MIRTWNRLLAAACAGVWILVSPPNVLGQDEPEPYSSFLLTGYGTASFSALPGDDAARNDFAVSLNPVILYSLGENILFESEFEIGLEGGATEIALEYGQLNYLGFERVVISAGKFLVPFGVFGERLHPTWINKLPSMPLVYGHAHGGVAEGSLLPILSDVGAMVRFNQPMAGLWELTLALYVTQGPAEVEAGSGGDDGHAHSIIDRASSGTMASLVLNQGNATQHFDIPSVAFGTNRSDNNDSKMLGARIGLVQGGGFEFYVSGFHAMYNEGDYLDIYGSSLSAEWRSGAFEARGEGAIVWQEFEQPDGTFPKLRSPGYYLQTSYRVGDWEPVVRWSQLTDAKVSDEVVRDGLRQIAFGINYWLEPSVPVKAAIEINPDGDDRLLFQWAYGF